MDMQCQRCQEPYDWFFLRNDILQANGEDLFPTAMKKGLTNQNFVFAPGPVLVGCPACVGKEQTPEEKKRQEIMSAVSLLLGDDIDGYMAEMEEFGDWLFGDE